MSSFFNKAKDLAAKASDKYQESKSSSGSSNQQSGNDGNASYGSGNNNSDSYGSGNNDNSNDSYGSGNNNNNDSYGSGNNNSSSNNNDNDSYGSGNQQSSNEVSHAPPVGPAIYLQCLPRSTMVPLQERLISCDNPMQSFWQCREIIALDSSPLAWI
jgi:hypothetical protein